MTVPLEKSTYGAVSPKGQKSRSVELEECWSMKPREQITDGNGSMNTVKKKNVRSWRMVSSVENTIST